MVRDTIIDLATVDLSRVIADQETIRRYNPQRFEMEQLTAVCFEDTHAHLCVGYKDITDSDFWVRGHMPGMPLMPGIVMIEAAAQVCSYYVHKHSLLGPGVTVGLGGVDEVKFREPVRPANRLVIVASLLKLRPKVMCVCHFQEFIDNSMVCDGIIKGIALPTAELAGESAAAQ